MRIVQRGKKWVLYGDDGKIIVITTSRLICEWMMKNASTSTDSPSV